MEGSRLAAWVTGGQRDPYRLMWLDPEMAGERRPEGVRSMVVMKTATRGSLDASDVPGTEELVPSYERHPAEMGLARRALDIQYGRSRPAWWGVVVP
ncbi:MAG: hypothetical protein M0Z54_15045 [Thermaerobacter sp.]|nr:hypothetical protein [Thermaerobacter sp.]